ncbi:MAG: hypothetical protein WD492_03185 [Alkalispirochaeta sp.]
MTPNVGRMGATNRIVHIAPRKKHSLRVAARLVPFLLRHRPLQARAALVDRPDVPADGIHDRIMDTLHELRSAEFYNLKPLADYRIVVEQLDAPELTVITGV